jgi:hypothetical protein
MTPAGAASQQAAGVVKFRFAFGAVTGSGGNQNLKAITEDTCLKTGDRIKLMVEVERPGFVYVLHRGPDDEVTLLFPPDLTRSPQIARRYYIPDETRWFELDENPGIEAFYVLGSVERLTALEAMLRRYAVAPAPDRSGISAEIVAEIRRLRSAHRAAGAPLERPVIIGGNVRSLDSAPGRSLPDVSTLAVAITANGFYARTFTITHQ